MKTRYIIVIALALIFAGCSTSQNSVHNIDPDAETQLSGKWNDSDAKRVAETMTTNILSGGWLKNASDPVLIVGKINNNTMEHISTDLFIKEIEKFLVNHPEVEMVADSEQREQIRNERMEQQQYSSRESAASLAKELGANYMLVGNIDANVEKNLDGTRATKFYDVTLELIDVEKNRKVWIEDHEVKKLIQRTKVNW